MLGLFIVEDHVQLQDIYRRMCPRAAISGDFEAALKALDGPVYAGYILNMSFPRAPGAPIEMLGLELADIIAARNGGYRNIVMTSMSEANVWLAKNKGLEAYLKEKIEPVIYRLMAQQ